MAMALSNAVGRDPEWIARLQADDEYALHEVMDAYFDHVAALAFRYLGSYDTANDVAQDTFIRLWDYRHQLAKDTVVRPYVLRIARNRTFDLLRHNKSTARLEQNLADEYTVKASHDHNAGVTKVEHDEFHALVRTVADTLTPRVREVLLLYFEEQLSPNEIAAVLEIAPKTVYAQLRIALKTYAKALVGRWP